MAVAISAVAPPSLHGRRSRLSRASSAAAVPPPLFAGDGGDARPAPPFAQEGCFRALMRGQCELLSFSDDDFPPPRLSREAGGLLLPAHMFCSQQQLRSPPPLSLVDALSAAPPISEDDVDVLAPMFSQEEIQALWAARQAPPPPPPRPFAGSRSAGEKRRSPASLPWTSCASDYNDDSDAESPPVIKIARTKVVSGRRRDAARAARLRRRLREWHGTIAARILRRQFRPLEPSRGRTALGCRCHELALAGGGGGGGGGCCALHQEAREPEDRAWMYTAQGRLPLVGGPGEVLVPTLAAGNSKATVLQYARWRRGVRMPSRFYLERATQQQQRQQGMMAPAGRWQEDDWMMMDMD
ncbi:unnamed protein product [Urochloa humidicola]